jgi:hypothetical protein
MMTGVYNRYIKCCDYMNYTIGYGAQFRYGIDSQYGDIIFIMKDGDWWKKKKLTMGHFWTNGLNGFHRYTKKLDSYISDELKKDANMFDFRQKDERGTGLECISLKWHTTWCNIQFNFEENITIDYVDTILVPKWLISDVYAISKMLKIDMITFTKFITNKMPIFKDGTKNLYNGKFVLYGPDKANDSYSVIKDEFVKNWQDTLDTFYPWRDLNKFRDPEYESTMRDPSPYGNSSLLALSYDSFLDAQKIYMSKLVKVNDLLYPKEEILAEINEAK